MELDEGWVESTTVSSANVWESNTSFTMFAMCQQRKCVLVLLLLLLLPSKWMGGRIHCIANVHITGCLSLYDVIFEYVCSVEMWEKIQQWIYIRSHSDSVQWILQFLQNDEWYDYLSLSNWYDSELQFSLSTNTILAWKLGRVYVFSSQNTSYSITAYINGFRFMTDKKHIWKLLKMLYHSLDVRARILCSG